MLLLSLSAGLGFFIYAENVRKMSCPALFDSLYRQHNFGYLTIGRTVRINMCHCINGSHIQFILGTEKQIYLTNQPMSLNVSRMQPAYCGGAKVSSKNSSILLVSVLTSLL